MKANGADAFNELVDKAINLIEFQIQSAIQRDNIRNPDVKTQVVKDICTILVNIKNRVERTEYVKYAVRELHVDERLLWRELRDMGLKDSTFPRKAATQKTVSKKLSIREQIELQFVQTLIQAPELISDVKNRFDYHDITDTRLMQVAQLLWEATENSESVNIQHILNTCEDDYVKDFISKVLISNNNFPYHQERINGCLKKLKSFIIQEEERRLRSTTQAQNTNDYETSLKQLVDLSNQRRAVVQKKRYDQTPNPQQSEEDTVPTQST